jgi:hypothetical protein
MNGVGIKRQVGSLNRDEPFHIGAHPNHATTAKFRIVGHGDKRESSTTQGMAGIKDRDGLVW